MREFAPSAAKPLSLRVDPTLKEIISQTDLYLVNVSSKTDVF